jgi:hypothetical protein
MLKNNPFFLLNVTTRDNKQIVTEVVENLIIEGDLQESVLLNAQKDLLVSKSRLEAEIKWFPDIAPKRIAEITKILQNDNFNFFELAKELNGVSQSNLIAHICSSQKRNIESIILLISAQQDISIETVKNAINSNRRIAGFPEVSDSLVVDALKDLYSHYTQIILDQILTFEHPGHIMTRIVEQFSTSEIKEKRFLELIADKYDGWVVPQLRNYEDKIDFLINQIKEDEKECESVLKDIIEVLKLWDEYAQPSQLIFHAKGLDEPRSKKIFDKIRNLSLWLANEKQLHQLSLELSKSAKSIFAELPSVSNKLDEDIEQLEDLVKQALGKEDEEPLAIAIQEALKDEQALILSLKKKEFNLNNFSIAGKLYTAFIQVLEKIRGTSSEPEIWRILKRLAIYLNNEKDQPLAAFEIIKTLNNLNPPSPINQSLKEDLYTIEGNLLGNELTSVIKRGDTDRAIQIIERLTIISDSEKDKTEWRNLLNSLKRKKEDKYNGWIAWGIIAFIIFAISQCGDKKSSSYNNVPSTPAYQNNYASSNYKAEPVKLIEIAPVPYSYGEMNLNEVRWCFYQSKRIDFINSQFPTNDNDTNVNRIHNAGLASSYVLSKYNALIDDYNSRCKGKYRESSKSIIDRELSKPEVIQALKDDGMRIMLTWNSGFWFN